MLLKNRPLINFAITAFSSLNCCSFDYLIVIEECYFYHAILVLYFTRGYAPQKPPGALEVGRRDEVLPPTFNFEKK